MRRLLVRARIVAIAIAIVPLAASCKSDCCAPPANFLSLFVGVRMDSAAFRSIGYTVLELVPTDQHGQTFVADSWDITGSLIQPTSVLATADTHWVQPADPRPLAAAILIDDSGSMLDSDPDRKRAAAAQLFWREFLAANPSNLVALTDFGWPRDSSTSGFRRTRILHGFTSNRTALDAALPSIEAMKNGGTHIYEAAAEVTRWMAATVDTSYRRMLVIVTDGEPSETDTVFREELFTETAAHDTRILAVGIGPASDQSTMSVDSAVAVVEELASRTGGVYSGTTSSTQLLPVLTALANVSTKHQLLLLLRLSPIPPRGTELEGEVTISGEPGTATARWSVVAP